MPHPSAAPFQPADFADLARLLEKDSGLPLKTRLSADGHTISLHSRSCDLALRCDSHGSLIIHHLFLPLPRHGLGSQILAWLKRYALAHGYTRLVVENLTGDEILCFCIKHGFHPASPAHGLTLPGLGGYGHFLLDLTPPDQKSPPVG